MKYALLSLFLILASTKVQALSLDNSDIRLLCPVRGQIEVILHRYEHTQESWGTDHFETGGGHARKGSLLLFQFANMDEMIFNHKTGNFYYWYADHQRLVSCRLLSLKNLYPVDIPYYRE